MDEKRKKQQELLSELESIKDLLDSEPLDKAFIDPRSKRSEMDEGLNSSPEIPILNELVLDDEPLEDVQHKNVDTKNATTSNVLPGQQSLFEQAKIKKEKQDAYQAESESKHSAPNNQKTDSNSSLDSTSVNSNNTAKENPFLPQHIRERLTKPSDLEAILAGTHANKRFLLPPIVKTMVDADSLADRRFFSTNSFLNSIKADASNSQSLESALNQTPALKESPLSTLDAAFNLKPKSERKTEETPASKSDPKSEPKSEAEETINLLIDAMIAQYLPEIEAKLRFKLKQALTQNPPKK